MFFFLLCKVNYWIAIDVPFQLFVQCISNLFLFVRVCVCVCVGFFSTWFKQQHASTFLNWWALITQSAHITRYSFDEQGNRLLFKRLLLQNIAKASEKKPSHFFFMKKNPTNEKANEFDYLPNLFEIIPTIIFLWPVFFLAAYFDFSIIIMNGENPKCTIVC